LKTLYYRADVLLADVVFSGGLGSKPRPIVVVSTEAYNQSGIKLIGAAITSNLSGNPRLGDVILTDWQTAGLAFPSAVRGTIITVDRVDVHRLGVMSPLEDFANIEKALALIMGF